MESRAHGTDEVDNRRDVRLATTQHASVREAVDDVDLRRGTGVHRYAAARSATFTSRQHMMVSPATLELTGRLLLGLETDIGQL